MKHQTLGKIARLITAIFILYIGGYFIVNEIGQLISTIQHDEVYIQLIKMVGAIIPFTIGASFLFASYVLFRNKRGGFWSIITVLLMFGLGGAIISWASSKTPSLTRTVAIFIFYLIPAFLLFVSLKTEPDLNKKSSIERAREILGEDLKHLSDNELHHLLKS